MHSAIAQEFLPKLAQRLGPDRVAAGKLPVELRLDARAAASFPARLPTLWTLTPSFWTTSLPSGWWTV